MRLNTNQIESEIDRQNRHWKNESFETSSTFYRHKYAKIAKSLEVPQISAITGIRRVGKTVVMKQLMSNLLDTGVNPNHVLFFTFDEALAKGKDALVYILNHYLENARLHGSARYYVFIDEVQYVPMWQHILKRYYDTEPNIKFVISGSSSLFIKKKSTESLAGRLNEYYLDTLSFLEYLELSKSLNPETLADYEQNCLDIKSTASPTVQQKHFVSQYGKQIEGYFEKYIKYGQFPEIALKTDPAEIKDYIINNVYKKTIEYDIPILYKIEKPDELSTLFQTIINETGSLVELQRLSAELAIQQKTLNNYLGWLEKSYLISPIYNYTKSFRKSPKLARKIYVASTNFFSPFHEFSDSEINSIYMGILAENYAYNLIKKAFLYCSFYRKRGEEVDFVVTNDLLNNRGYKLFESKYVNDPTNYKYGLIKRLGSKFSGKYTVLTKNLLTEDGQGGLFAPLWMFRE